MDRPPPYRLVPGTNGRGWGNSVTGNVCRPELGGGEGILRDGGTLELPLMVGGPTGKAGG